MLRECFGHHVKGVQQAGKLMGVLALRYHTSAYIAKVTKRIAICIDLSAYRSYVPSKDCPISPVQHSPIR